jgi:ribosomal protein S18 acetylase RimI-like enzyme
VGENGRIAVAKDNGNKLFHLIQLDETAPLDRFDCRIPEYAEYLKEDALRSQADHVAKTWLLWETERAEIAAYMSLIADAVKLSVEEKELHHLDYPFKTIPAMKVAKLAVDEAARQRYRGIGTYMLRKANQIARRCNDAFFAARFLTVDADIEHDDGVLAFYEKNGFAPNAELTNKKRKTISMRLDLYR